MELILPRGRTELKVAEGAAGTATEGISCRECVVCRLAGWNAESGPSASNFSVLWIPDDSKMSLTSLHFLGQSGLASVEIKERYEFSFPYFACDFLLGLLLKSRVLPHDSTRFDQM